MKQLYSLHKRAVKFLMPIPNLDYKQKCCALKLLPLDKQLLLNKCFYIAEIVVCVCVKTSSCYLMLRVLLLVLILTNRH